MESRMDIDLRLGKPLRFDELYRKELLYRSVISIYTKTLFVRRKARSVSWDGQNLYQFAFHGKNELQQLHLELVHHTFRFSPAKALRIMKNGKERIVYVWPWRERVVDLMLYQILNSHLDFRFSKNVFAFRWHGYGIDFCQNRIRNYLARHSQMPLFLLKRDVSNCFPSISHQVLAKIISAIVPADDYLHDLLWQHTAFSFFDFDGKLQTAACGVPFGAPTACLLANLSLLPFDDALEHFPDTFYSRYADDMLFLTPDLVIARKAEGVFQETFPRLDLVSKGSASINGVLSPANDGAEMPSDFILLPGVKHLGIYFKSGGKTSLALDKQRKLCRLFRQKFDRMSRVLNKKKTPEQRARCLCQRARSILERQQTPVAIIDVC